MIPKKLVSAAAAAVMAASLIQPVVAQQAMSLDELLRRVEQGRVTDNREQQEREQRFRQNQADQQRLLQEAQASRTAEERRGSQLEAEFSANEVQLTELTSSLEQRLGSLRELFGVMQQVAGDARGRFDASLTNIQYPDRGEFLEELVQKIARGSRLPSLEEIDRLWFELQREMTESGRVVKFSTDVIAQDGTKTPREVIRVGLYNIVSDGKYLNYESATRNVSELPRQPEARRFVNSTQALFRATEGKVAFGIDPTLGGVLASLLAKPNLTERVQQGGLVGYLIIALGVIGVLIALERMLVLVLTSRKVTAQLNRSEASQDNPLGRVLSVYEQNRSVDTETLELKMSEAIFKEAPALNRALLFIKIISVVAPLMGLLGTVVGMINTFQAITLYGTGDPKLMAGGISQALVTTVLGLCVAIPMVLLHTLVSGRSRRIVQVLQEQSAGIIARHAEKSRGAAAGA